MNLTHTQALGLTKPDAHTCPVCNKTRYGARARGGCSDECRAKARAASMPATVGVTVTSERPVKILSATVVAVVDGQAAVYAMGEVS